MHSLLGLKAVGVTGGTAVGFVVLARFVMFVPVTLAGLFVLLHSYRGFRISAPYRTLSMHCWQKVP